MRAIDSDLIVVCVLDTTVGRAITDKPTEMLFAIWTLVGPGNHVLDGDHDPLTGRGILGRGHTWAALSIPNVIRQEQRVRCGLTLPVL